MEANFNVRKLQTNDEDLCKLINLYEKNECVNSGVEMNNVNSVNNERVLGLYWYLEKDIISLKINKPLIYSDYTKYFECNCKCL